MISKLSSHKLKKFVRSLTFQNEIATSGLVWLIGVVAMAYLLGMGFNLNRSLEIVLDIDDTPGYIARALPFYFFSELSIRYLIQSSSALGVAPYLHLPIKRTSIAQYFVMMSLLDVTNLFTLFLFGPFSVQVIFPQYGITAAIMWLLSMICVSLIGHFIIFFLKFRMNSLKGTLLFLAILVGLVTLNYISSGLLQEFSVWYFQEIVKVNPVPLFVIICVLAAFYLFAVKTSLNLFYLEVADANNQLFENLMKANHFNLFGKVHSWFTVELKLIFRNRRPRSLLLFSLIVCLYGLAFYNKQIAQNIDVLLFINGFILSVFLLNYGQFLFGWQGQHFDLFLTRTIGFEKFVEGKYRILVAFTMLAFLLNLPYSYYGWSVLLVIISITTFNLGVNVFIIMFIALWNPKPIELEKGSAFSFQGTGAAQWVNGLPVLLAPPLVYAPFRLAGYPYLGIACIGFTGLVGVYFKDHLIKKITFLIAKNKYSIAGQLRNEENA